MLKNNIRVDKFLWCVRFYKTRTLSKDACNKSKIRINSKIAKSSSIININDTISIKKREILITIKVIDILDKRISAKLVSEYIQDITPEEEKIKLDARKKITVAYREKGQGRPTKKERRKMNKSLGDYSKL
tara:strand:- start:41 stop:433 length:393 start_codon:yes stop_codon:yes gene_type:complete